MKFLNYFRAFWRYIKTNGKITNLTISQVQYSDILSKKRLL